MSGKVQVFRLYEFPDNRKEAVGETVLVLLVIRKDVQIPCETHIGHDFLLLRSAIIVTVGLLKNHEVNRGLIARATYGTSFEAFVARAISPRWRHNEKSNLFNSPTVTY